MMQSDLLQEFRGYVDGAWIGADSGKPVEVSNPANGELLAAVPDMGRVETDRAALAARKALAVESSAVERATWLSAIDHLLRENREELGRIITLEQGKPWPEAQVEVDYAAGFFRYYAHNLDMLEPRELPERPKQCCWTVHQQRVGVVALITPWNFPLAMLAKKLSAAIAADCSCLVKPSSKTPLTVLALFTLLTRHVQIPAGKLNLLVGGAGPISDTLCASTAVDMLSFTGSTQVGAQLMERCAPQVKRLSLELGGNAPFIVFADADLDRAVEQLLANKFRAAGQTCVCANRILVEAPVVDAFTQRLTDAVARLRVGNGMDPGVDLGPLIDRRAHEKVRGFLRDALDKGAHCAYGEDPGPLGEGQPAFFPPVVLSNVQRDMACCRDEVFGPILPVMAFADEQEAVALGNDTDRGLAAYVFSGDRERARRVALALHFGYVGLDTGTGPTPEAPFGGMKRSGYGREGGLEGLHEFVEAQTLAEAIPPK